MPTILYFTVPILIAVLVLWALDRRGRRRVQREQEAAAAIQDRLDELHVREWYATREIWEHPN